MKYLIFGLGKTGFSVVKYLLSQGHDGVVFDTRLHPLMESEMKRDFPHVPCFFEHFPDSAWEGIQAMVMSPGLDSHSNTVQKILQVAKDRNLKITSDIELFFDHLHKNTNVPVIGITGSNGKSTVTALVYEMLKASGYRVKKGGNYGIPALDLLGEDVDSYVLELSSFQLELLSKPANLYAAVVLNISPNHLDRHETMDNYQRIKTKIYDGARFKIFRASNENKKGYLCLSPHGKEESFYENEERIFKGFHPLIAVSEVRLLGRHNIENSLAALALIDAVLGEKDSGHFLKKLAPSLQVLRTFEGLPHRCRYVLEKEGVTWINDSKSTTSASTLAALGSFGPSVVKSGGKIILIAGGQAKGATFENLATSLSIYGKALILLGQDAEQLEKDLSAFVRTYKVSTLKAAVELAKTLAKPKDWVLLSPACASLDMFKNYEHRGEVFEEEIRV